MLRNITNRLLQGLLVLFVLGTLTFFLVHALPYGPFQDEKAIPEHVMERLEKLHGYDKPLLTQYLLRLKNIVQGDLGVSIKVMEGREISEILGQAFPVSLALGIMAMFIATAIGIPAGIFAGVRKNTRVDYIIMAVALLGICLPNFVIGPLLAEFFGGRLGWFPVAGWDWGNPASMLLPAITLGLVSAAYLSRLTRAGMLETLNQDFIRTARAKGLTRRQALFKHGLRTALIPMATLFAYSVAGLVTGAVFVEKIFGWHGMGEWVVQGISTQDTNIVAAITLFSGAVVLLAGLLSDVIYAVLDPRVRVR